MKNNRNFNALNLILLMILSLTFISATQAQSSTDQSAPTAFATNEITAKGPSKETNYYYSFTGGPGEVTVSLNIKAKQYSTFARLEVLDAEFNTLATHNMNATTGSGPVQVTKKIELGEKQTVLLKLTLDGNLAEYKVKIGGAVELGSSSSPSTDSSSTPSTDSSSSTPDTSSTSGSEAQPDPGSQTTGDATSPPVAKEKKFSIDFKSKLGQLMEIPKSGTLIIQMKDGTTQEIPMKNVKSVTVKP